jgi:hypothetical protein
MDTTVHNPDRYMGDLRQILAQGRKRIGLLIGAGAPASIQYNRETQRISSKGEQTGKNVQKRQPEDYFLEKRGIICRHPRRIFCVG